MWKGVIGDVLLVITAGTILWFIWTRFGANGDEDGADRIVRRQSWGWVRLLFGLLLAFDIAVTIVQEVKGQTDPRFSLTNGGELTGAVIAFVGMFAVGIWLMWSGLHRVTSQRV